MKQVNNIFKSIISPENIFASWEEFKHGKTKKDDVLKFSYNLEGNIFSLARELANKTYCPPITPRLKLMIQSHVIFIKQ
ncbi:MAG: hypothetical protein WC415_05380 [Patescibacteria group bacterium]|jgi:hypothetical protein